MAGATMSYALVVMMPTVLKSDFMFCVAAMGDSQ
jgi:hypothetical protein